MNILDALVTVRAEEPGNSGAEVRQRAHREQRMPASREEVLLDADRADRQQFGPLHGDQRLERASRDCRLGHLPLACQPNRRRPVDFAAPRKR